MKKFLAFLLAVLLLASLSLAAFAEDAAPGDIIITNTNTNHTYLAYELFAGTVSKSEGNLAKLGVQRWGCDITDAGKLALCQKYLTVGTGENTYSMNQADDNYYKKDAVAGFVATKLDGKTTAQAKEFAKLLVDGKDETKYLVTEEQAQGFEETGTPPIKHTITFPASGNTATIDVHHQGYYLVVDTENSLAGKTDVSYTDYILTVVADQNVTVAHKNDVPKMIKKVQENTAISAGNTDTTLPNLSLSERYNDTADYSIGDEIPYELVASLPSYLSQYNTYKMVFHDTMNGMKYVANSIEVLVRHTNGTVTLSKGDDTPYTYTISPDGKTIELTINMTRTDGAFKLKTADGTTTVDAGSYIIVRYKAALDDTAAIGSSGNQNTAYLEYSNNPTKAEDLGKTTDDKNIVYTYGLDILKRNAEDKTALPGAEFTVQRAIGDAADPNGYAIFEKVLGTPATEEVEAPILGYRVTGWGTKVAQDTDNPNKPCSVVTTGEDGYIHIYGLDRGHYFLKETEAPTDYTKLVHPIEVAIDANVGNTQAWAGGTTLSRLSLNVSDQNGMSAALYNGGEDGHGQVGVVIANNATAQLPTTGGVGTTLFYVFGTVLALGAALIFVIKRRMSVEGK